MDDRGVFEDKHTPTGTRVFKIIGSVPGEVGIVVWPNGWSTPAFIEELEREAQKKDGRQLRVI